MKIESIKLNNKEEKKEELLTHLRDFLEKNGRPPMQKDFMCNSKYPSYITYCRTFGSWNKALELLGMETRNGGNNTQYTKVELLDFLQKFYDENKRIPICKDFDNNPKYPSHITYYRTFGGMNKALKLINLDIDSIIKNGNVEGNYQKGRLFELKVIEHFEKESIDLSGNNFTHSHSDGICPSGHIYDAKSASLNTDRGVWQIKFRNKYKHEIQWYYIGLFDDNYSKLLYALRIPASEFKDSIDSSYMNIYLKNNYNHKYTIDNMKQFIITEKFINEL